MADRYWVGVDGDWHDGDNWATTSGGAGGAGVPTAADDVFIDGNGYVLCYPTANIVCNNMSLLSGMTEMLLIDASAVINGDFSMAAGYFGPTGGPDHTVEFKGNWLNTGGTFAVGTGTGKDPECIFSGTSKTYNLNQTSAASFQHLTITGEYVFSGTRLAVANVTQTLKVTGTLDIQVNGTTVCDVRLIGNNSALDLTGEITGTGRLQYQYKSTSVMDDGGIISVRYMRFDLQDSTADIDPRAYTSPCEVEVDYDVNGQQCRLKAGKHYFYKLTLQCDNSSVNTAGFDCKTNKAKMWLADKFNVDNNSFPNCTLTISYGPGPHVMRGSIDMYFAYTSATTHLVVDAADTTLILWPNNLSVAQYRLSRIYSTGVDVQTYYIIICYSGYVTGILFKRSPYFLEGFNAFEFIVESRSTDWSFRKNTDLPYMDFDFDRFKVIGDINGTPMIRSRLSLTPAPADIKINYEQDVFACKVRDIDFSNGIAVNAYNSISYGTNTNVEFYDRDVRIVGMQRNIVSGRNKVTPTPPPEPITEQLLERWAA